MLTEIRQKPPQRHLSGFTFIEVLVASFIIVIGLLGIAGMKSASMQATYGSYGRTQAVFLAYEIIDTMRANRDTALEPNGPYVNDFSDDSSNYCGGSSIAERDLCNWLRSVEGTLPAGKGSISVDSDGYVTVKTRWDSSWSDKSLRKGEDATNQLTFTAETRL